jgi:hypothetical protein
MSHPPPAALVVRHALLDVAVAHLRQKTRVTVRSFSTADSAVAASKMMAMAEGTSTINEITPEMEQYYCGGSVQLHFQQVLRDFAISTIAPSLKLGLLGVGAQQSK